MQGSVAIPSSPVMMEDIVFRQKLGLSFRQIDNNNGSTAQHSPSPTARCLFGVPDPKLAKDLVREVELKNALSFGKRFNFDIIQGEPFISCGKRMTTLKESDHGLDSDEENVEMDQSTYMWTESYDQDFMAKCNKQNETEETINMIAPSRHTVSLLFAPITTSHQYHQFTCSQSPSPPTRVISSSTLSTSSPESPEATKLCTSNKKKSHMKSGSLVKKNNVLNSVHHGNQKSSSKKTSIAQQIITKYAYTNRMIKHALSKKPRKISYGRTTAVSEI